VSPVTEADVAAAVRTALRCLERRSFATADLARRLRLKGHLPEAAERALVRVTELGLLNDAQFAVNFVHTRAARGRGPSRLRRDLQVMGVGAGHIEQALAAEWPEGTDGRETIQALARRRVAQLGGNLPRQTRRRRVLAYLARRGFNGPVAREVVRTLIA
jgi:regulatory protein